MTEQETVGQKMAKASGQVAVHLAAVVAGMILMVIGLGMGVSLVMLPIGIPVGLVGLLAFIWGLFGWAAEKGGPVQPPAPQ